MKNNKIHNINRSKVSNQITTFLDKYQTKFTKCPSISGKSANLKIYYDYFRKNHHKFSKVMPTLIQDHNLKNESDMDLYLDNLDTCESHYKRDQYKSKFTTILKMLHTKYPQIFTDIFQIYDFSVEEKNEVLNFIQNLEKNKLTEDEVIEWFNFHGSKLARSIYIMMLEGKLPGEIKEFFGQTPEIYGQFTSLDIQKDIELNIPYGHSYEYQLDNIDLELKVYSYKSNYNVKRSLLDRLFFLHYLTRKSKVNLTLWLSPKKKVLDFDRKDRYIGPKEINSGCTTFSGNPKVSIWRSEEMDKVILHEIIHSLDLEQRQDLTEIEEFIYQHFDIRRNDNKFTIFESYVETFADIINLFLLTQDTIKNSMRKSKSLKGYKGGGNKKKKTNRRKKYSRNNLETDKIAMFYDILQIEIYWMLFQTAKILHYFRYKSFSEFYYPGKISEDKKTSKYIQKSNIFSYIVIRGAIFFKLDEFMGICDKYNLEHPLQCGIPNNIFIKFLKDCFHDKNYQDTINNLLKLLREIEKKKNVNPIIYSSMRMTCVEHK